MGLLDTPNVPRNWEGIVALVLGIVGLGGVGTIIAGIREGTDVVQHVIIGILQLVIPFVGWVWGLIWGILIFIRGS